MREEFIHLMIKGIIITSLNEEGPADYWKADERRVDSSEGKRNHHHITE